MEQGETCAYALARELEEEAGIRADTGAFELVSVHANHAFFPNDHVLVYRITAWTQGEATQKGEIAEIRFVDPRHPPDGVTAGTKRRLDELFGGKPRGELW